MCVAKGSEKGEIREERCKRIRCLGERVDEGSLVLIVLLLEIEVSIRSKGRGRESWRLSTSVEEVKV